MSHRHRRKSKKRERKNTPKQPTKPVAETADPASGTTGPKAAQAAIEAPGSRRRKILVYAVTLVFTVGLGVVGPAIYYYRLSATYPAAPTSIGGLDIRCAYPIEVKGFVGMMPSFEKGQIRVDVSIDNAKEVLKSCRKFTFLLPGTTTDHRYVLPATKSANGLSGGERKPLTDVKHSPFGYSVVTVDMKEVPDFIGTIEYLWLGFPQKRAYAEYEILLTFFGVREEGDTSQGARQFRVSMPVRQQYRMKDRTIEPMGHQMMDNVTFYYFDVNRTSSTLDLMFTDEIQAAAKDRYQTYILCILGAALSVVIAEVVMLFRQL